MSARDGKDLASELLEPAEKKSLPSQDAVGDDKAPCSLNGTVKPGNAKRQTYISWEEYFMGVAHIAAMRSKDPKRQVGAVIVNKDKIIVGTGYNGMPNGCSDDVLPWGKSPDDFMNDKNTYVCHAEMNAIMNKNCSSTKGSTMYTVLFPCNECAKLIIQAGIREVVYQYDKPNKLQMIAARKLFDLAKVSYRQFTSNRTLMINFSEYAFSQG